MADSQELPKLPWLDRNFVAAILRHKEGQEVSVQQLRVVKAVGKGENYASLLLRVGVDFTVEGTDHKPRTTSLIVKCFPLGELTQVFIRESGIFERELKMYTSTLPAIHAILDEAFPPQHPRFFGTALHCDREEVIVLEDLRESGFRMCNRQAGLDLEHSELVLRNLARLHAASVLLHARDPQAVGSYTDIMYKAEKRDQLDKFITPTLESFAKIADGWTDSATAGYAEKMRQFNKAALDKVIAAVQPSKTFLNVLNHGDCWVNNCMFKYKDESGELEDMKFIDFQMTRYSSPALDIQYFLYTSVQHDVRETSWSDLLTTYTENLNDTLRILGHGDKVIDVEALEKEMAFRGSFGLVASCMVLCAVMADPSDAIAMDEITQEEWDSGETKIFDKAMSGTRFNAALKRLLPHFVRTGVL